MTKGRGKIFKEVFQNIPLSRQVSGALAEAEVYGVRLGREQKKLLVDLKLCKVVPESCIRLFQEELQQQFPFVSQVAVDLRYALPEQTVEKRVSDYWDNILYTVHTVSPICAELLSKARWELAAHSVSEGVSSPGVLRIEVANKSSFIFMKKGLDKTIESLLATRLQTALRVVFQNSEEKEDTGQKEREDWEAQLVQTIQTAAYSASSSDSPLRYEGGGERGKKIPRKAIKINSKLVKLKELDSGVKKLSDSLIINEEITVEGELYSFDRRETKKGRYLITFELADRSGAVTVKFFIKPDKYTPEFEALFKKNNWLMVKGMVQYDIYSKELNIMAYEVCQGRPAHQRMDNADEKRVELHLHTQMSAMDAVHSAAKYIQRAELWGHKAVAITDHGVTQAYPEAMQAAKGKGVKVIYGVEAYLIDDLGAVVQCPGDRSLNETFVVFDLETTGLSSDNDKIIEIGAVRVEDGKITDTYSTFVNPGQKLRPEITKLTSITDGDLTDAHVIAEVLPGFLQFVGDAVLVAHNASFDVGFLTAAARQLGFDVGNTVLDTVGLSRTLFPQLTKHKLDVVAKHLGVSLENHHRAVDDAGATAEIFIKCLPLLMEQKVETLQDINLLAGRAMNKSKLKYSHAIILVKNAVGLKNLYELVSESHITYFAKRPRIPKSEYVRLREGLIIGTACEAGEFYRAVLENKPEEYLRQLAEFYDYFEIQPIENNSYLVRDGKVASMEALKEINKKIVALGEKYRRPVVATGDVHFMDESDEYFRRIILAGEGYKDADDQAPLYYRTTEEMLAEFRYLGEEKAKEVVITNPNEIADIIEEIKPIPDETFPPEIEGAEEELTDITMKRARELYGEELPSLVLDRLERELSSIIKNGFAVMYVIAQKLVSKSMEDGYLVGSRGSVGSSFVATMAGITEVNPLPPHYLCPSCRYSDFGGSADSASVVNQFAGGSGCDMPDQDCPSCGTPLLKDGHDIPFETFLGFDGDKEPDIDLNFSGEYQAKAHAYTEELFGEGNVFKAGTIGTMADKTAYGYVKKYLEERNVAVGNAEMNRLVRGLTGIKRTTGQHPGGLMILPAGHSIYEFCPIQRPANDMKSNVTTTHFDYHSISGRLLKLDILGHDVPTIIRMLQDITGVDPQKVPLGDPLVMSLFTSPHALGVTSEEINCQTGTLGLPEFGTGFVRQMLMDTQPASFAELVRISGLSHGTDVWLNNAQELIAEKKATLKEVIPTRDDIMVYLIIKGVERKAAFKIMENVRKGKGLKEDEVKIMQEADVPDWYIESCRRIKYMFPKGHAVAYVMMTVRIGYFKIHHPYSFYAASFSVKAEDFDYELMCMGREAAAEEMKRLHSLGNEASAKDKNTITTLELVLEFYARGLRFAPLDLYRAQAAKFTVTDNGLLPPLCSIQGLGVSVAQNIVEARKEGEFYTIEDFRERTKTNKTVLELLRKNHIFDGVPETDQLSLV